MNQRRSLLIISSLLVGFTIWAAREAPPQLPPAAADQIYNDDASQTSLTSSILGGGLSSGTIDVAGNLFDDPMLVDPDGADRIPGSIDDVVEPGAGSPAVNAGDNGSLPPDRFDLDGDGDTTEPFPIDIIGSERVFDSAGGGATTDMGAFERTSTISSVESDALTQQAVTLSGPYPNPVATSGTLSFEVTPRVAGREHVKVAVYDVLGRLQSVLYDGVAHPATQRQLQIDASGLPSGLYFIRLESAWASSTTSFVVAR